MIMIIIVSYTFIYCIIENYAFIHFIMCAVFKSFVENIACSAAVVLYVFPIFSADSITPIV